MSRQEISPTYLIPATVLSVDSQSYRAEVALENLEGAIPDVEVASLYCHPAGGEGIYFLPEVGSTCYLFYPSDDSRPVVLGYRMPLTKGEGDSGGRLEVNPGDYVLLTRGGGKVILRREGAIEIGATALAQRLYIPLSNFIRDIFEQYEAQSPLGDISWTREETPLGAVLSEATGLGSSRVRYRMRIKEFAEDDQESPKVTLEVGEQKAPVGPTTRPDFWFRPYISLKVTHPLFGLKKAFELYVGTSGTLRLVVDGSASFNYKSPVHVDLESTLRVLGPSGSCFEVELDGTTRVLATSVVIHGLRGLELWSNAGISLIPTGPLLLGDINPGGMQRAFLPDLFLAWLATVQSVDGILVGPPPPPTTLLRSTKVWVKP